MYLEQLIHHIDSIDLFCKRFRFPHQNALRTSCNSIHILNLRRLDIINITFAHNPLTINFDQFATTFCFNHLSIMITCRIIYFLQPFGILIIPITIEFNWID